MRKQLKETTIYQPNEGVRVTVQNTPATNEQTGEILYRQVVTLKVDNGWVSDKLSFGGEDDLRKFMDEIVLEDPQQELPL